MGKCSCNSFLRQLKNLQTLFTVENLQKTPPSACTVKLSATNVESDPNNLWSTPWKGTFIPNVPIFASLLVVGSKSPCSHIYWPNMQETISQGEYLCIELCIYLKSFLLQNTRPWLYTFIAQKIYNVKIIMVKTSLYCIFITTKKTVLPMNNAISSFFLSKLAELLLLSFSAWSTLRTSSSCKITSSVENNDRYWINPCFWQIGSKSILICVRVT